MTWEEAVIPRGFNEFVGQSGIRQEIELLLAASRITGERVPHILLTGEYGLGKTTLGKMAAGERGYGLIYGGDFDTVRLDFPTLVIDEIHRVQDNTQLCVLMDAPNTASVVGCTTDPQDLTPALRSRFIQFRLMPYTEVELSQILERVTRRLHIPCDVSVLLDVSRRAKGVARVSLNYLRRLRDRMIVIGAPLTVESVQQFFEEIGVTEWGLTRDDLAYLSVLSHTPTGLQQLASRTGLTEGTILEEVEPFLLRKGLVLRTPRGRVLV